MHDDDQAQHGEALMPAELAQAIADGLARLAHLAAQPEAAGSLPAFSAQLAAMAVDQAELARELALRDAIAATLEQEARAAARARGADVVAPVGTLAAEQASNGVTATIAPVRSPLTFDGLSRAVKLLTSDAKTRVWPQHEAAALPGVVADAVKTVQAATRALHAFLAGLRTATALHDARGEAPPSVVATGAAVEAATSFVRSFDDVAGLAAPLDSLAAMLLDVQAQGRPAVFSRVPAPAENRTTRFPMAWAMGQAAVALDARWQAARLEAASRKLRPPKVNAVARIVAEAVAPALAEAVPRPGALPQFIVGWRDQAMKGLRGDPKGFKQGHPTLTAWHAYVSRIRDVPELGGRFESSNWVRFAETTEARVLAEAGINGRVAEREKGGSASPSIRKAQ